MSLDSSVLGRRRSLPVIGGLVAMVLVAGVLAIPAVGAAPATVSSKTFTLRANPATIGCLRKSSSVAPTASVTVTRGAINDALTLTLSNFKPNLGFDLFTVQRSLFLANGTKDPNFTNFGLAWYQSDVHINTNGDATVTIRTILLDQIFGFDPDASLAPTNTFHVGFWFDNPADAAGCGFTGSTPFNGEHNAGPVAFISRPVASGLGPLCTQPNTSTSPATCNP